ncbi:MAG: hypothetical protein JKY30_01660 [Flavobacteriales bacterium]|nr:hypothetical protein [Flavobacteriales bacterium]
MKKVILVLALFTTIVGYGQDLIDANGDKVAEINTSGVILDGAGQTLGEFLANGDVKDLAGNIIGKIEGTEFKDSEGIVLGSIDTNNNVFDLNNSKLGTIQAGLMVIDANNHLLGRASASVDSKYLAAYFFFFFSLNNF